MIGYICGKVTDFEKQACFIETSGIGYRVFISNIDKEKIHIGDSIKLHTYMAVREDDIQLYGFLKKDDYDLFMLLISISKIGPKVAMGILSSIDKNSFCNAVRKKSITTLTKLPGIGKKTAERLVLELKDKIGDVEVEELKGTNHAVSVNHEIKDEALLILKSLGYQEYEIYPILENIGKEYENPTDLVRVILKEIGKKRS